MQLFHFLLDMLGFYRMTTKHILRPFNQLLLLILDLVGMYVERLG